MKILKKILLILFKVIKICAIIFIVLFVSFIFLQRFSNNKYSFMGYRMFSVASKSMEPTYLIGDIIITKNVTMKDIQPGDDITYQGMEESYKDKVITHRVIKISKDKDNNSLIITKGINNPVADPAIKYKQIYGKVVKHPQVLSKLNRAIQSRQGFYALIFIPLGIIVGSEMIEILIERYKKKKNIQ